MSLSLLQSVIGFLQDASLLDGLAVRYYRWTDADLNGNGNFIVVRMSGTSGIRNATVQSPDVRLLLVFPAASVTTGSQIADAIFAKFSDATAPYGVLKFEPLSTVSGPYYLDNGRGVFEIIVRCFVQDH
jgi:hypothetical protein